MISTFHMTPSPKHANSETKRSRPPPPQGSEPTCGGQDGAETHTYWELWAGGGLKLVWASIYLSKAPSVGSDPPAPPVLPGPPTSGSDEPNWKHVLHAGPPCDRWDKITLLMRERERERRSSGGGKILPTGGSGPDPTTFRLRPRQKEPLVKQQKPLWLQLPASLLAGAAAPVVKVPLTCTKLVAGPEARYPASTGNPEHARITVAGGGSYQRTKQRRLQTEEVSGTGQQGGAGGASVSLKRL